MSHKTIDLPTVRPFTLLERAGLVMLIATAVSIFHIIADWFGWPRQMYFSASLLASDYPIMGIGAMLVGLVVCLTLGALLLGRARYEAGLFTASCGLAALASRGGTISALLHSHPIPMLYHTLFLETALLLGVIALSWMALAVFTTLRWSRRELPPRGNLTELVVACVIQMLITALIVFLLARSDAAKQSMAAVFIAAMIAALTAHQTVPVSTSLPFWGGTLLTGVAGFAWAAKHPQQWQIGLTANPLASVSPLAYASLGTAGAILGYWISLRWHDAVEDETDLEHFEIADSVKS